MFIVRFFTSILSLIFKCLSLIMKGLQNLLAYGGGLVILAAIIVLVCQGSKGIQNAAILFIVGLVSTSIGLLCFWLELDEKIEAISLDFYFLFREKNFDTFATSGSTRRSDGFEYSFPDYTPESSPIDHDGLDAVQAALRRCPDAEAPGPDPETFVNIDL